MSYWTQRKVDLLLRIIPLICENHPQRQTQLVLRIINLKKRSFTKLYSEKLNYRCFTDDFCLTDTKVWWIYDIVPKL